ncbi:hypothetical protein BH09BAC3_BH09BAC3_33150 [soil metagenome]
MQRIRNKYLLASFVFLTIVSAALLFLSREGIRPVINKDLFRVDTDKIDEVILQSPTAKVQLKFESNQWKVNDKWGADAGMIKVLFATLKQIEPRRPVASVIKDSIRNMLEQKGVKVTLSGSDVSTEVFYAAGNTLKTETWFMKADDPQPYTMVIPGYRVYVAGILELDESGWRNKRIFDFNERNFKALSFAYVKDPKQNFEIELKGRELSIKNMQSFDSVKLDGYLGAVSLIFASRFIAPDASGLDSLVSTPPEIRIEIKDIASRTFSLELFAPKVNDPEVYGRLGDGQLVAIDRDAAADIVRSREYFLKKADK